MAISGFAYAEEQETKLADQESKQVDQETNLTDKKAKPVKPVKLKRKCIKQNPLLEGQTDQELLQIYQQVCDKSNAHKVNDLLAQAAMRMYELKQPMNALTLANQLHEKNVQGTLLTDVTFLASVEMANTALQQMRAEEVRYLSQELTYPPAKELSENIRTAMPVSVLAVKKVVEEAPKKKYETPVQLTVVLSVNLNHVRLQHHVIPQHRLQRQRVVQQPQHQVLFDQQVRIHLLR